MKYDFEGWATKNDLRCSDGRIIRRNAFSVNDGKRVPLVWNHQHNSVSELLGHAILKNRDDGVWAYGYFNNTTAGRAAKEAVQHGDVSSLSIWANNLTQKGSDVVHGVIRELSLVLAGANPGAFIESVVAHGLPMDEEEDECLLYTGEDIIVSSDDLNISHAEESPKDEKKKTSENESDSEGETIGDVYNTLTDKQKKAVAVIVGQALADENNESDDEEEEDDDMKHNIFEGGQSSDERQNVLSHEDIANIFKAAKTGGSLRDAFYNYFDDDEEMMHALDTTGMTVATGTQKYGFNDPSMLFPEFKTVGGSTPEWLSRNMDWVNKFFATVHRTPFSRIKSVYANITEDEARARGYIKGKQKKEEVFTTLKRTTDPQTVYKKQKLDRDDIVDITDFDIVAWIRAEMRVMLNEECARAALIGDGRQSDSDDKIQENHIRPIATDVSLFNTKVDVVTSGDQEFGEAFVDAVISSRKKYKGSGNPTLWTTEDVLTEMLMLKDKIGHRLYKTEQELATTLRVSSIETVEPMEGTQVDGKDLLGIIVNLADYNIGADKGGEISTFDDFDIDFNQMKYLIETRISGALVKPFSALTFLRGGSGSAAAYQARRETE